MKIKKKIVIPVVAVALVGIAAFAVPRVVSGEGSKTVSVTAASLAKMDLENIVSVTGTVKSEDATNVYSTLAYQVQSVNVEVGDRVNEGDVLCVLDTESLNAKIDQQSASLSKNQASTQHNLAVAKNNLETEKYNQDNNYDTQLLNAEQAVEKAEKSLVTAKSALENARINLTKAEQNQRSNRNALKDYKESTGITSNHNGYDEGYDKLYQAVVQGELTITQRENDVVDAEKAVEDAEKGIKDAKESLAAIKVQKEEALITSQQQVQSAQINANLSDVAMQIDELKKDLDSAIIKAPVSGVVTAVLATEGGNGQGLLFVIEDTQKLKVTTKIKEYDIVAVRVGQQVKIKSDGTGDNEYEGKVSKIAPTAVKAANGETVETTDVQFATEVGIVNVGDLKIGMNARIDIITEQKPDVFAVSYESVIENENGESVVFVARPQTIADAENGEGEEGQKQIDAAREAGELEKANKADVKTKSDEPKMIAVAIPVTTGMETDFYIQIISESLKEGDLIISNPSSLTDGQEIMIDSGVAGARGMGGRRGGAAVRMG